VAERRRLPVIQPPKETAPEDEGEARPPWHWIGFGTVAIFAAWLVLAYAAGAIVKKAVEPWVGAATTEAEAAARWGALSPEDRARVAAIQWIPHALAFALAAFAGGYLVGRFGKGTSAREAATAGAATAGIALIIAAGGGIGSIGAAVVMVVVVAALGIGFAAWGGRTGARARDRSRRG
jgi:tRNA-(ms[2]io[6]A)-hydroxylase